MPLKYHQGAFDVIAVTPEFDPAAEERLSHIERERDFQFPASMREWYSQRGAVELLDQKGYCIESVSLENLGRTWVDYLSIPRREVDPIAEGHLTFLHEVQGGTSWTVRLDGSDDPPVFVENDFPKNVRSEACSRFSTFTYCHLWDFRIALGREAYVVVEPFDNSLQTIIELARPFAELPRTHFCLPSTEHRFQMEDHALLIQINDDDGYMTVTLAANDFGSLSKLLTRFRNCIDWVVGGSKEGADVFELLKKTLSNSPPADT